MRIRLMIVALAMLAALMVAPAAAQDATPTAVVPDPELCTLKPLTPEDLQRIADSDLEPSPTSTPITGNIQLPGGEELFTSEREEVEKDIVRAIACVNTGEPLKALAAYTDVWIAGFIVTQGGLDDALIAGLQVDRALQAEQYLQIISFGDAARMPDGRVAIVVVGDDPADDRGPSARLFIMAEVRPGRFLIDEVVPIEV
jgi:hypothetical protein